MKIGIFALLATLAAATGTLAAPPNEQTAPTTEVSTSSATVDVADADADRKICRTEKATGSLTRRTRICLTAAQWREVNDRTRRGVDEMNSSASGGKICVPNPADPFQGCS